MDGFGAAFDNAPGIARDDSKLAYSSGVNNRLFCHRQTGSQLIIVPHQRF